MSYATIRYESADGIGLCTVNRPDVRNALNETMVDEIRSLLGKLSNDPELKVLVFTGAGEKAFVAGADIGELRDRRAADALRRINSGLFRDIETFEKPTIAAIRGVALGGGLEFAMACDLRVAAHDAKVGQPEVALGIIPGAGATYRLPRLVGLGRAKEIIFTGQILSGDEAREIGLVNRTAAADSVVEEARALATQVAKNGALAVRLAKSALNSSYEISIDAAMALESSMQGILFDDSEKVERMTRFLERRK